MIIIIDYNNEKETFYYDNINYYYYQASDTINISINGQILRTYMSVDRKVYFILLNFST